MNYELEAGLWEHSLPQNPTPLDRLIKLRELVGRLTAPDSANKAVLLTDINACAASLNIYIAAFAGLARLPYVAWGDLDSADARGMTGRDMLDRLIAGTNPPGIL